MKRILLLLLFVGTYFSSFAAVRLPAMIGDKMVLQRDIELSIWGWADANEKVTVTFQNKYYYTEANQQGQWLVKIPPLNYGGPYHMEINDIVIRDILIGDVWLCSGQSNMETPIIRLLEKYPEINSSNNHMIRYFKVPTQNTVQSIQENIPSGNKWISAVASEVTNWTALAYFYAVEAYNHSKIPQGMLVSSLGGSAIESWISQEYLKEFPRYLVNKSNLDSLKLLQQDPGAFKWMNANWDDSKWKKTSIPNTWKEQGININGVVYYRKNFSIPINKVGRFAKLYLGNMTDSDSIFINGKFIGSTSYMYPPRIYNVPANLLQENNLITIRLRANNGNGEFVADKPYKIVIDDFEVDLKGEWRYKEAIDLKKLGAYKDVSQNLRSAGSGLYNGMIYPLQNYGIKGVLWYQGESNTGNPEHYKRNLELLVTNWRALWNNSNLPFLFVQLPNFMRKHSTPTESGWAKIREAQFLASQEISYSALAVCYDIGEWNDIHPLNKKDIAKRLFLGARKIVFGENIINNGPIYSNYEIDNNKIILSFSNIGTSLQIKNGTFLKHFAIAGDDRKFVWATATIKGNKIVVSHPDILAPKAVRYAWADNPEDANLINKNGLLASPFRTDKW